MRQTLFTIQENVPLTASVYRMRLCGDTRAITVPGQFVNLKIDGLYLRRPISVCDVQGDELTLIYKIVGEGTACMARMRPGQTIDALTGLGNGYDLRQCGERPVLLGGGVGAPPLYLLAKRLLVQGLAVSVRLGFNTASEVFYADEFYELGCEVEVATADGSYGRKGFVTDILPPDPTYYYACGPIPMLKAVYRALSCGGQMSFEERMGCGFGACMGCSITTASGSKRVCRDGPVFRKEEIVWEG